MALLWFLLKMAELIIIIIQFKWSCRLVFIFFIQRSVIWIIDQLFYSPTLLAITLAIFPILRIHLICKPLQGKFVHSSLIHFPFWYIVVGFQPLYIVVVLMEEAVISSSPDLHCRFVFGPSNFARRNSFSSISASRFSAIC